MFDFVETENTILCFLVGQQIRRNPVTPRVFWVLLVYPLHLGSVFTLLVCLIHRQKNTSPR